MRRTFAVAIALLFLVRGTSAFAQGQPPPDASRLRLRVGPLTINPTIGLTNLGVDQNVFNEPTDLNPKSDFTFTVTPAMDLRLRVLRSVVTGNVTEDLVWYQTHASERTANNALTAGWLVPFNRFSFNVNARHATLHDRPGFEIDKDEDGKIDRWEYYDANQKIEKIGTSRAQDGKEDSWSYPNADGTIARIDVSAKRDGKISRVEHYQKDILVSAEEDGDGDGRMDKWETYEGDHLASIAFDTTHRGTPDRRLIYGANGTARLEVDPNGTGQWVPVNPQSNLQSNPQSNP